MVYNVNNIAIVTLTKRGARVLNEYLLEFYNNPDIPWKEGAVYCTELWHLMKIFGKHFVDFDGEDPLFVNNAINIDKD